MKLPKVWLVFIIKTVIILFWKNESQYSVLDRYLNAGSKAVREILPDALVTLHIETPNRQIYSMIMDAWEKGNVDYDINT